LDDFARYGFMIGLLRTGVLLMHESADRAEYIGEIAAGMARIARDGGLTLLAFILEMAALEARRCAEMPQDKPMESLREMNEPCHR
jgi:hypothetical protein